MSKMSFLEKIDVLFKMSKSSYLYLLVILVLLVLGIIFSTTNSKTISRNRKIYAGFSIFILLSMILIYHSSLGKIFDYMMNNLFIAIYFPNLAIYLAALIITNIIVWISIFHYKTSEYIKKLNCVIYIIMNYLLFLILSTISKKSLDVFKQESVYGNKDVTALIELSSIIFIVWIIFLIIYKVILIYIKKDYQPKVKKVVIKKKIKKLPVNFEPVTVPDLLYGTLPNNKKQIDEINQINEILISKQEKNLEIEKEIVKERQLTKEYENLLTLEDYKKLLKILKQKNKSSNYDIVIDYEPVKQRIMAEEEQAYREKQKQEIIRLEEERKESLRQEKLKLEKEKIKLQEEKLEYDEKKLEDNLTELERLYRGIQ